VSYIEREAFKKHIKDLPTWWADGGGVYGQAMKYPEGMFNCDDVIASIENAPAADVVEVRHGSWVRTNDFYGFYMCSNCRSTQKDCQPLYNKVWHYCPNCGAKMDGERKCEDG
jgi:predicted RNA-binding Zn-ribbon protein involved in translation (DUF1610 family)